MMSYSTICILVDKILILSELIQEAIFKKRFSKDRIGERNYIAGNYGKMDKREIHQINTPFTFICGLKISRLVRFPVSLIIEFYFIFLLYIPSILIMKF